MKNISRLFNFWVFIFIAGLGGLSVMPSFSGAPPLTEEFLAETLPDGGPWFDNSSPEGRIEIAYDDTDSITQLVPLSMPLPSTTLSGDRHRGNFYECTTSGLLVSQGIRLDRTATTTVIFFVYESSTENGTYTLLSTSSVAAGIGNGVVQSGAMKIPMVSGKFYLIGAKWDTASTYYYKSNYHPNTMPLGNTVGGFSLNNASAPAASLTGSPVTTAYQQEVTVSTNRVMRMDDSVDGSLTSTNSMDLVMYLEDYTDVKLRFRHRESGDEYHSGDGIFLSDDNVTFVKVYDLDPASTAWQTVLLDIDALASANGLVLNNSFFIRFQQVDDYGWPTDGREFDDIKVYSKPDLEAVSVESGGLTSITKLWKGFDSPKHISMEFEIDSSAGLNNYSAPAVTHSYNLKDSGGTSRWFESTDQSWSIDGMETRTDTLYPFITISPATKLNDLNYTLHAVADSNFDVTEAFENNNEATLSVTVNHYSGVLWFDNIETDITILNWSTRVANSAIEHTITGTGTLNGKAFDFTNLKVDKNLTTLDYSLDATEASVINVFSPGQNNINGIRYWHGGNNVELSINGAYANLTALLPAGLGVSASSSTVLDSTVTFINKKLTQELYPDSSVTLYDTLDVAEETKPLRFHVSNVTWNPATAEFLFGGGYVRFTMGNELDLLDQHSGDMLNPDMAIKKSNLAFYRKATLLLDPPEVQIGADGEALLTSKVQLDPTTMTAHFPYGVDQEWVSSSEVQIIEDLIDSATSFMIAPTSVNIDYARDCNEDIDCAGSVGPATMEGWANGPTTAMSRDGGLRTQVDLINVSNVKWGTRWNNAFTQETDPFINGALYIPGHFIRGDLSSFDVTDQRGPAEILLSGMAINSANSMERPSKANYADGFADYAGLNLRVGADYNLYSESIVGGTASGLWPLTGRSKYYLRHSGVSGIHEAVFNSFPASMTVYDYSFGFSNYGLSYLSNTPEESRINGDVFVQYPNNITMDFEELMLDCLGELEDAELANSDTKTLEYWDADIQPLTLFFAPTANSTCGNAARKLCMGLTTQCANVDQTLSGVLGFLPTGELGAPADQIVGVPSRLAAPNKIELAGPGNEIYYFNPVANPYYNDYSMTTNTPGAPGWINFAGNLDVAFFSDLQVQFHTSASTNSAVANIYMAGGWTDSGATFFDSDPDGFDLENAGFPHASVFDYYEYRNSGTDTYRTRAQRKWLNVVDFDYPLEWSFAAKSFKSPEEIHVDLMVVNVEHQTDYLSADNAEISFGVQYDGIPQINLANMAFNAINETTGMASAFGDAVGAAVRDTIDEGISAMDDTLADLPEMLFDPLFEQVLDPMIDDFYNDLQAAYAATPDADYYSTVVTQYIQGVGGNPVSNANHILKNMANGTGMAVDLIDEIDGNLAEVESLINAFIGTVSATNGVSLPSPLPGLLNINGGEYKTLTDLGVGLLSELAEPLYDSLSATIEEELNSVLEDVAPSLEAITDVMQDLQVVVSGVRSNLAAAGSIVQEINGILNTTELNLSLDEMAQEIDQWLAALPNAGATFDEYTAAEIKGILRQKITDAFYASVPCADVQQVVRSQLYEVDAAIQQTIDSAFQQLNKALRDLASEFLTGIDDEINGMLGDLSDVMGAGQIDGYAHIRHDTLFELRIDGKFQWEVPEEMEFNAYLIIRQLDSDNMGGCGIAGEVLPEVTLGTTGFGISWLDSDIKADIATKFTFKTNGSDLDLIGLGGSFEMVEGQIGFESFAIDEFYAAVAFGKLENYLSANLRCSFTSYEVEGGAFFGKTCSLAPFSWDPDVQEILGDPPFTGVYVYGEGWMPIVDFGCLFRVKAGVGAGIFAFVDGPVGGKIFLGADGEALCVVNVAGEVTLVGLKDGDDMRMNGKGRISGRVGSCPFCIKFGKTVTISYDNGEWDADY